MKSLLMLIVIAIGVAVLASVPRDIDCAAGADQPCELFPNEFRGPTAASLSDAIE